MVKRLWKLVMVMLGVLLLSSCYIMTTRPTGTISLRFGDSGARSIGPTATVRVYLYMYNSTDSYELYTFPGGKQYVTFSYGSGTQTLTGIPVGLWQVLVSAGNDGPNGSLQTTHHGQSEVVNVIGGNSTVATVTTSPSPFVHSADLLGQDLNGVCFNPVYSTIYASSSSTVWKGTLRTVSMPTMQSIGIDGQLADAGLQINSIDNGKYYAMELQGTLTAALFVNTNEGIVRYDEYNSIAPLDTDFSQYLTDASGGPFSVLHSSFVDTTDVTGAVAETAIHYRSDHGLGGVVLTPKDRVPTIATGPAPWIDIPVSDGSPSPAVHDFIPTSSQNTDQTIGAYAYFATRNGAFWSTPALVSSANGLRNLTGYANYFTATISQKSVPIQAVRVLYPNSSIATLFIGTPIGAFSRPITQIDRAVTFRGDWTPVPQTGGDNIIGIAIDDTTGDMAFRSTYNIYTLDNSGATPVVTRYPFHAGVPGQIRAMTFVNGTLFIAGTEGLVSLFVSS